MSAFTPMIKIGLSIMVCGDAKYKQRAILYINYFKIVPSIPLCLLQRVVTSGMIKG